MARLFQETLAMQPLNPKSCFACDELHDLQVTEALGQFILLCKDCRIDWQASNTREDVVVNITYQKIIDQ